MDRNNTVTAVIPTRNRPQLVLRAVRSALAQTYKDLEVIVVVDGPDAVTSDALATIMDDRLRVIVLPQSQGAQMARNTGIEAANGDWIALLDDDDEWLPEKTELQMERAVRSAFRFPMVSCRYFSRASKYELIWPRKQPYEPLSEYLLARNSCSMGEGMIQTLTLLFPKDLYRDVPFTPTLRRCHDVDWVLRASKQDGVGIEFLPQPLAISYEDPERARISSVPDWRSSLDWVESVRETITPRAYASYVAIQVASHAARQGDWSAFSFLFKRILTRGKPKPRDIAFFLGVWFVPRKLQLAVRKAGW
jgi:glycosyltransferase involved in cell wall biosynthesis